MADSLGGIHLSWGTGWINPWHGVADWRDDHPPRRIRQHHAEHSRQVAAGSNQLELPLRILSGRTQTRVDYFGLAPNAAGLYQFNVVVLPVPENSSGESGGASSEHCGAIASLLWLDGQMKKRLLLSALWLCVASGAVAQTAGNWTRRLPESFPPRRSEHSMAFDSARNQTVLFGGRTEDNLASNETWIWDGSNWSKRNPTSSPPPRFSQNMVYDSARGVIVLFGGAAGRSDLPGTIRGRFNDTWTWDGTTWTKLNPQTSPPALSFASMAYDSARGHGGKVQCWRACLGIAFGPRIAIPSPRVVEGPTYCTW